MPEIRFQFDEHIPHALASALRSRGIDVVTAAEAGLRGASDDEVLERSFADGRVLFTQDADFLALHSQGRQHAGIAYCQQRLRTIGQLVASLALICEILEADDMVGRVEYL